MKLLLLGKTGQVGWELQRALGPIGELVSLARADLDLQDLTAVRVCIRSHAPHILVNAAAYTAVDRAQSEAELARRVNGEAVDVMAREMRSLGGMLVNYSTDYVFDGTKATAYVEDDAVSPLSVYGESKCLGEQVIRESGVLHLILRTSWVYSRRGTNFAQTILRLARERDALRVVDDQFGAPTSAELIAEVTALMLCRVAGDADAASLHGTYHLCASGITSWDGYAKELLRLAWARGMTLRMPPEAVEGISAAQYAAVAKRPASSALDCGKLQRTFGIRLPDWREHLVRFVEDVASAEGES